MQTADLDVIKDIPGYKVILKTILRSQIQQLVEQLEQTTEEESIILTASVNDGTLCHLGSDSGKTFLNDHDDIKSQFLGFCLKRSHQKNELAKQKALEEEQAKLANQAALARTQFRGTGFVHKPQFSSKFSPRNPTPHPVNIGVGAGPRTRHLVRHAPYAVPRGTNIATRTPPKNNIDQTVIKIEADSDNSNQSATDSVQDNNKSISETGAQFTDINSSPGKSNSATASPNNVRVKDKTKTATDTDGVKTEEDKANISANDGDDDDDNDIEDLPAIGLSLDSDLSNLVTNEQLEMDSKIKNIPVAGTSTSSAGMIEVVTDESDPTVSVKVEAISEADMELEITGVELGNVTPGAGGEWGGDESGMIYDGSGAIGDQSDLGPNSEQAYNESDEESDPAEMANDELDKPMNSIEVKTETDLSKQFACKKCSKMFKTKCSMYRHLKIKHDKKNKFICLSCTQFFSCEADLKAHKESKHSKKLLCSTCGKEFSQKNALDVHSAQHGSNIYPGKVHVCPDKNCNQVFYKRTKFEDHLNIHSGTKPYSCQKCGKAYANRYSNGRHERVCMGFEMNKCEKCDAVFKDKGSMKRHIESIHDKKVQKCGCGKIFKYYSSLYKHKRDHNHW